MDLKSLDQGGVLGIAITCQVIAATKVIFYPSGSKQGKLGFIVLMKYQIMWIFLWLMVHHSVFLTKWKERRVTGEAHKSCGKTSSEQDHVLTYLDTYMSNVESGPVTPSPQNFPAVLNTLFTGARLERFQLLRHPIHASSSHEMLCWTIQGWKKLISSLQDLLGWFWLAKCPMNGLLK